ncbi:MAG: hypothetical protein AAGD96_17975 [Chloroflexota bacterium]
MKLRIFRVLQAFFAWLINWNTDIADWGVTGGYFLEDVIDVDGFKTTVWARNYEVGLMEVQLVQGISVEDDFEIVQIWLSVGPVELMMRLVCSTGPTAPQSNFVFSTKHTMYEMIKRVTQHLIWSMPVYKNRDDKYVSAESGRLGPVFISITDGYIFGDSYLEYSLVIGPPVVRFEIGFRFVSGNDPLAPKSGLFWTALLRGKVYGM